MFKKKKELNTKRNPTDRSGQRVFSYYTASRNQLDDIQRKSSDKTMQNRQRRSLKNIIFFSFILITLFVMVGYLSLLDSQATIQISGPQFRNSKEYQTKISTILEKDFRNKTKYFINTQEVQNSIYNSFPEAMTVKVSSTFLGHRPIVKIETYKVIAIFNQSNSEKFLLSDHGKILIATDESQYDYFNLPIINNTTNFKAQSGMQFFNPNEAKDIADIIYQLNKDNTSFNFKLNNQPQGIDLYETGKGYYVKFLLDEGSILKQYGAMRAFQKKQLQVSEYIDVRLADKVFYK